RGDGPRGMAAERVRRVGFPPTTDRHRRSGGWLSGLLPPGAAARHASVCGRLLAGWGGGPRRGDACRGSRPTGMAWPPRRGDHPGRADAWLQRWGTAQLGLAGARRYGGPGGGWSRPRLALEGRGGANTPRPACRVLARGRRAGLDARRPRRLGG